MKLLSRVRLFATPWTVAHQAPQSMEFSRQEYWSGVPFPSPGDLPNPGIEPRSPTLQADTLPSEPPNIWALLISHGDIWQFITLCKTKSKRNSTKMTTSEIYQGTIGTCFSLLHIVVWSLSRVLLSCDSMHCKPARLLGPWDFLDRNAGVGAISSRGSSWHRDLHLLYYRWILYHWTTRETPP